MYNELIEYIKIHQISLIQDLEKYTSEDDTGYIETIASITTTRHLLSVANDIMNNYNERVN